MWIYLKDLDIGNGHGFWSLKYNSAMKNINSILYWDNNVYSTLYQRKLDDTFSQIFCKEFFKILNWKYNAAPQKYVVFRFVMKCCWYNGRFI